MDCVLVTNAPSPYRVPVYQRLPADRFTIAFCAYRESHRAWEVERLHFEHVFLRGRSRANADGFNFVYHNPEVWGFLNRLRPGVVITTGFNPTHLYAFAWAKIHQARHVYMTDGTLESESHLGVWHRGLRRLVFELTDAFIVASSGGARLLNAYGIDPDAIFYSRLCTDVACPSIPEFDERPYDVMFCGQIHERKLPFLFADICGGIMTRRARCKALVVGDGPLKQPLLRRLAELGVEVTYPGFVQPKDLPGWYSQAKLLLFTTRLDAWGVVANESMACGTPVLTSVYAGAAGDLIVDGLNGRVLDLDAPSWIEASLLLLDRPEIWQEYSRGARKAVEKFDFESAAKGIVDACRYALKRGS